MATVHAQVIGEQVLVPRGQLERLVELARQVEAIEVRTEEDDLPAVGLMLLAQQGGAFDWLAEEELYSVADLKVRYR
jgi:hypothetical protein